MARVKELLETVRAAGFRVFFMRHMSLPKEASGVFQLRTAMAWQRVSTVAEVRPWFLRESPGFQLVPELNPLSSEVVFDKITMSAFEGTPTVRHGADLGYIPIVVTDACGAGHPEAADRALASMRFMGDAILTDIESIRNTLGRTPAA